MSFFENAKGENIICTITGEKVKLVEIFNGQLVVEGGNFNHMSSYGTTLLPLYWSNPNLWKIA